VPIRRYDDRGRAGASSCPIGCFFLAEFLPIIPGVGRRMSATENADLPVWPAASSIPQNGG